MVKRLKNLYWFEEYIMKVVINRCHGGFGLSHEAIMRYAELKGFENFRVEEYGSFSNCYFIGEEGFYISDIERTDTILIQVVEELGNNANGKYSDLHIVEIPDDISWEISDYEGMEKIHEKHRSWS